MKEKTKDINIRKNEQIIDSYVQMYCMGVKMVDIAKEIGIAESTAYSWKNDRKIKEKIERYREEIQDTGVNFVKGRYVNYLMNVDKLANQTDDKRTALSANQFMIEKLDGKATTNIDLKDVRKEFNVTVEGLEE